MRKIGDLVERARELKDKGMRVGEISEELNVSRQTAEWLVSHAAEEESPTSVDLFVDWSNIGSSGPALLSVSAAIAELVEGEPDALVGIAVSGLPIATSVATRLDAGISVFHPGKRHWEPRSDEEVTGAISSNFLNPKGMRVAVIDDIVTTGSTAKETVSALEDRGCEVTCVAVLVDKSGLDTVNGIPLKPLIRVGSVR
ncbi:MAG: Hypoxanthine/guanine phosphoribosyltransferase [Methanonatronarchaeales archaeon]|nr:Hypoxanthine/guanine phosphoribosyltransferase [Methanonatronarchaeales archaeon]